MKLWGRFQALDVQPARSRPLLYATDAAEEPMSRAPELRRNIPHVASNLNSPC